MKVIAICNEVQKGPNSPLLKDMQQLNTKTHSCRKSPTELEYGSALLMQEELFQSKTIFFYWSVYLNVFVGVITAFLQMLQILLLQMAW